MEPLEQIHRKIMKMTKGLDYLSYKESLKELDQFSLEKRKLREEFINVYKYLKEWCQEDISRLFFVVASKGMRGNRQKLVHRKLNLNRRKNLTLWVTEHGNRLPRECVDLPHWRYSGTIWTQFCALCSRMTLLE